MALRRVSFLANATEAKAAKVAIAKVVFILTRKVKARFSADTSVRTGRYDLGPKSVKQYESTPSHHGVTVGFLSNRADFYGSASTAGRKLLSSGQCVVMTMTNHHNQHCLQPIVFTNDLRISTIQQWLVIPLNHSLPILRLHVTEPLRSLQVFGRRVRRSRNLWPQKSGA